MALTAGSYRVVLLVVPLQVAITLIGALYLDGNSGSAEKMNTQSHLVEVLTASKRKSSNVET